MDGQEVSKRLTDCSFDGLGGPSDIAPGSPRLMAEELATARPLAADGSRDGLPSTDLPLLELAQSSVYESRERPWVSSDVGVIVILVGLGGTVVVAVLVAVLLDDLKSRFMALRMFSVVFWKVVFGWT